jgi:hypothetical protein
VELVYPRFASRVQWHAQVRLGRGLVVEATMPLTAVLRPPGAQIREYLGLREDLCTIDPLNTPPKNHPQAPILPEKCP